MQNHKIKVATITTELAAIRAISDTSGDRFECAWTREPQALMRMILDDVHYPHVVIVDNSALAGRAIDVLESVRRARASIKRVLLTDHCDLGIIVKGLHTGAVQSIVYKPIHPAELLNAIGVPAKQLVRSSAPVIPHHPIRAAC